MCFLGRAKDAKFIIIIFCVCPNKTIIIIMNETKGTLQKQKQNRANKEEAVDCKTATKVA